MKRLSATSLRSHISLPTVLGFGDPDLPDWDKVRAAQVRDLRRMLPLIWATQLLGGVALASILWRYIPHWQVAGWFAALAAIIGVAIWSILGPRSIARCTRARALILSCLRSAVCGAIWAVPPALFATRGVVDMQIAICLVLGGLIASAPITLSAIPLAMTCFVLPIALGLTAMMIRTGSTVLALLPAVYALAMLVGGFASGRTSLRRRWMEMALDHEAGLVSLLLREFEANDADWLWEIDVRKRLIDVGPRLAEAFGRPAEKLNERPLMGLLARGWASKGGHPTELRGLLDLLDARRSFKDHVLPVLIEGEPHWWRLSATPRYEADGTFAGFRGVGSDITEQRRSLERIDRLARADGLTDIDNRRAFTEKLRVALESASSRAPCALMLVDLDRFKAVNDTYGHPVGDRLLRAVAGRLAGLIGQGDACGRLGGDEFALLVANAADIERIDTLGGKVLRTLTQPFEIDGNVLHVGASIGIARAPYDGETAEDLMRNADLALYRVKHGGRGAHQHFVPELLDRAERRAAIEQALRVALDHGEFRIVYQPVVDMSDSALVGFEALLRWNHPVLGDVGPEEFVPIAGSARLIGPIGDWVLHTACTEAANWPSHVRLSINLSPAQALDAGLPMAIRAALAMSGLAPGRLELEIAESTFASGGPDLAAAIEKIRATGVRLVLDDFGTGFGCIRQAPFSTIKLARGFLDDEASSNPENIALVRALVTMADLLGVVTTAKGAETGGQRALARRLGCRQIQGNIAGPPLSAIAARMMADRGEERRHVA
jgi:diguanylate cyclase (GGDEF)-like protein